MSPNKRPPQFKQHLVAIIVGVLAVLKILSDPGFINDAIGQDGSTAKKEFRFEDYTGDKFGSQYKGYEAAKAHLYQLFPKGSQPERLAEFIVSLGGDCKERSEPNYIRLYGNALFCRYRHWVPQLIYASNTWIIYIYRENNENEVSKIQLESRIDMP